MLEDEVGTRSAVMTFARVKYWSRKANGPRLKGQRPLDLRQAAMLQIEAFEKAWRAGYSDIGALLLEVHEIMRWREGKR